MRTTGQIRAELPPELDEQECEALVALALRMEATRPRPTAGFRDSLRQGLTGRARRRARAGGAAAAAQPRLAAAYALAGSLLLAVAALGVAGVGPFAAG